MLIWCRREDQYTSSSSWTPYPVSTYTYHPTPIDTHWWLHLQFCISTLEDGHEPCPKHVVLINQVKQAASRWLFTYTITYVCVGPQHIFIWLVAATRIQHNMDNIKQITFIYVCNKYTEYPRRNVPNFGRVFLMLNYTDITQNTYIQS